MASFQIKNFVSIVASMINRMKATQSTITDFNVGAVERTMIEAPAIEIDQLYQQMFLGLMQAIPVATFNSFSFAPLAALSAAGLLVVNIAPQTQNVLIPAGTVFTFPNGPAGYATVADVTITAGNTSATMFVAAVTAGALGNIQANTAFTAAPVPQGFVSATNPSAFQNGTDTETPAQQQQRFTQFIASLPRGTVAAVTFGAMQAQILGTNGQVIERVASAAVVEPFLTDPSQPIGLVQVYVHNGVGSTSAALVSQALQVVDGFIDSAGVSHVGWKAAGVVVQTFAATEVDINYTAFLTAAPGFSSASLLPLVTAAINNYILSIAGGGSFVLAVANALVMAIPGVANIVIVPIMPPPAPVLGRTGGGSLSPTTYYVKNTYTNNNGETLASVEVSLPVGVGAPASAPTLGSVVAGSIGATTYFAKITYVNALGETLASAESSLAVAANSVLTVASPPASGDATGWNVYISTSTGTETKQNSAPIPIGTIFTEPTSGLIAGTTVPAGTTALGILTVASPPAFAGATAWNPYIGTSTGTETKQSTAPLAIGTNFIEPTGGLIVGASPPTKDTAQLTDAPSTMAQKLMPGTTTITPTN